MKMVFIATAVLTLMSGSAFAQTSTGPAAQQDKMTKPGVSHGSMDSGSMEKGAMSRGTVGMEKGGMKPDASGQGGSGPGSDQGGTKVAPRNTK